MLPKASRADYQAENLDLFDWELSAADMAALSAHATPAVAGDSEGSGDCTVP